MFDSFYHARDTLGCEAMQQTTGGGGDIGGELRGNRFTLSHDFRRHPAVGIRQLKLDLSHESWRVCRLGRRVRNPDRDEMPHEKSDCHGWNARGIDELDIVARHQLAT
jgi:hypothetical protein